jgi:hypothetical protein
MYVYKGVMKRHSERNNVLWRNKPSVTVIQQRPRLETHTLSTTWALTSKMQPQVASQLRDSGAQYRILEEVDFTSQRLLL